MSRVEALLEELSARHGNREPRFHAAVRPLLERILAPGLGEAQRLPLLELLAETFERDAAVRRDAAAARACLRQWFANLRRLLGG